MDLINTYGNLGKLLKRRDAIARDLTLEASWARRVVSATRPQFATR
jgi:hypothetical protein